jgi:hypothetical protein
VDWRNIYPLRDDNREDEQKRLMVDLSIAKTGIQTAVSGQEAAQAAPGTGKVQPSRFDDIRSQLAQKVAADLTLPPPAQISSQQQTLLESALRKRLTGTQPTSASQFFGVDRKNTQLKIQSLTQAVNKLPNDSALDPIRDRLTSIATQFEQTGQLIGNMKDTDPKSLLNVQMQMYQMSQNVEIMSKVVDQVNSGVKTVLQTQV